MKIRNLLYGTMLATVFAGCSTDNDPAADGNMGNGADETSYMAINLALAGNGATTRAYGEADANGFVASEAKEVKVNDIMFFFMNGNVQVADPYLSTDFNNWNSDNGTVDKKSSAIVVLRNAVANPTSIIAVVNPTATVKAWTKATTLTDMKAATINLSAATVEDAFVMSNSVFVNDGEVQIGAPVKPENIKKGLPEAAEENPVNIYVEKIPANVTVKKAASGFTATTGSTKEAANAIALDGSQAGKTVTVDLTGWWLDNRNESAYLIKNLNATYTLGTGTWNWNDAANYRSYWATSPTCENKHLTYTEGANQLDGYQYAAENTSATVADNTKAVVKATLKIDNAAANLVKYLGKLYTKDYFNSILLSQLADYNVSGQAVKISDLNIEYNYNKGNNKVDDATVETQGAKIKDYEAIVTVKAADGVTIEPNQGNDVTFADAAATLTRKVQYWQNGNTYYFVPVTHTEAITVSEDNDTHKLYGIVRNHLYNIVINSVAGLGTPVPDDTDTPIIPVKPVDDNSYISATINILKYKQVDNVVDLD